LSTHLALIDFGFGRAVIETLNTNHVVNCDDKFHCQRSNQCIFYSWRCDDVADCELGEDEVDCNNNTCPDNYYRCPQTGHCVPISWICEGNFRCSGHSEPVDCRPFNCSEGRFKCYSGLCIANYFLCDGDNDCEEGEDETDDICLKYCSSENGKYLCDGQAKCISSYARCNGEIDCSSGSDEKDCPKV